MYQLANDVLYQFDHNISENEDIVSLILKNPTILDKLYNNILIVLSKNGSIYELNLTSGLIFKDIVDGINKDDTISNLCKLYNADHEKISKDYDKCCAQFILDGFIINHH